ncbi:hypothetical protein H2200_002911 [Cladophialophora chaetospira]|uniref:Enoyl reductase (ER) domain-containing protein n=1 Tax=Cladophialophora chaetospira TaxID=386627 RepID=A0AA38XGC8_9EURO|nr:hypothetical protein H2200_002911 [Cladophialophora chaetospira]
MSNYAAIIPSAKAPLEVKPVETYKPEAGEILVKNEVIAFNPVEAKIAKLALLPVPYPSILGTSFGGTVEAVGTGVTDFKIGDKVAVRKNFAARGNQYGSFQKFALARCEMASKIPSEVDLTNAVSMIGNLSTTIGLFAVRAGLDRPSVSGSAPVRKEKILVYGGSSSLGSLSVQWLLHAGYQVVTTSSPKHQDYVSKLGELHVIDHTQPHGTLVEALASRGPYDLIADMISLPPTTAINAAVMAAQGGGTFFSTLPAFGPETLPEGVKRVFASWPDIIADEDKSDVEEWVYRTYFPQCLANGRLLPYPIRRIDGGLGQGINDALEMLHSGKVSGVKLVADPWE